MKVVPNKKYPSVGLHKIFAERPWLWAVKPHWGAGERVLISQVNPNEFMGYRFLKEFIYPKPEQPTCICHVHVECSSDEFHHCAEVLEIRIIADSVSIHEVLTEVVRQHRLDLKCVRHIVPWSISNELVVYTDRGAGMNFAQMYDRYKKEDDIAA